MVDGLNAIPGITCLRPKGAFYVFPNISGTGMKSKPFADQLLQDHGVAALSGTAFGEYGEGYLRLSYANSEDNLQRALERIRQMVADLGVSCYEITLLQPLETRGQRAARFGLSLML